MYSEYKEKNYKQSISPSDQRQSRLLLGTQDKDIWNFGLSLYDKPTNHDEEYWALSFRVMMKHKEYTKYILHRLRNIPGFAKRMVKTTVEQVNDKEAMMSIIISHFGGNIRENPSFNQAWAFLQSEGSFKSRNSFRDKVEILKLKQWQPPKPVAEEEAKERESESQKRQSSLQFGSQTEYINVAFNVNDAEPVIYAQSIICRLMQIEDLEKRIVKKEVNKIGISIAKVRIILNHYPSQNDDEPIRKAFELLSKECVFDNWKRPSLLNLGLQKGKKSVLDLGLQKGRESLLDLGTQKEEFTEENGEMSLIAQEERTSSLQLGVQKGRLSDGYHFILNNINGMQSDKLIQRVSLLNLGLQKGRESLLDLGLQKGRDSLLDLGLQKGSLTLLELGIQKLKERVENINKRTSSMVIRQLGFLRQNGGRARSLTLGTKKDIKDDNVKLRSQSLLQFGIQKGRDSLLDLGLQKGRKSLLDLGIQKEEETDIRSSGIALYDEDKNEKKNRSSSLEFGLQKGKISVLDLGLQKGRESLLDLGLQKGRDSLLDLGIQKEEEPDIRSLGIALYNDVRSSQKDEKNEKKNRSSSLEFGLQKGKMSILDLGLQKGRDSLLDLGLQKGRESLLDLGVQKEIEAVQSKNVSEKESKERKSSLEFGLQKGRISVLDLGLQKGRDSLLELGVQKNEESKQSQSQIWPQLVSQSVISVSNANMDDVKVPLPLDRQDEFIAISFDHFGVDETESRNYVNHLMDRLQEIENFEEHIVIANVKWDDNQANIQIILKQNGGNDQNEAIDKARKFLENESKENKFGQQDASDVDPLQLTVQQTVNNKTVQHTANNKTMPDHDGVILLSFHTRSKYALEYTQTLMDKLDENEGFKSCIWEKGSCMSSDGRRASVKYILHYTGNHVVHSGIKQGLDILKNEEDVTGLKLEKYEYVKQSEREQSGNESRMIELAKDNYLMTTECIKA